jgi:thermitase
MNPGWRISKLSVVAGLALLCGVLRISATATEHLTWRKDKNSVDADISSWGLIRTLETISEATGWQVFIEPGTRREVSTKFKGRQVNAALDLLLGDLGRVLLPGTNGSPSRLLVFRSKEKAATELVKTEKKPKPIPDELIVTMKDGKSVEELAKKLGAKVVGKSNGLNSGRLKFDSEDAANAARDSLRDNEEVASTDPNFEVSSVPTPAGTGAASQPNLRLQPVKDGEALIIGLIDTAVQKPGGNFDSFLLPSISVAGQSTISPDRPSHGTSMFETLLRGISVFNEDGSASRVRVLPVDVYGPNGTTTTYEVAEGIFQAMKNGAQIINLSLGSEGNTPYLYQVIRQGRESGRIFVGSAGNTPVTSPTFPAAYPEVIAVTAGVGPGQLAPYANRGSFVDVMAPGSSIISFNGLSWRVNGTSPAAAYISGAIAGTLDTKGGTLSQAAAAVQRSLPPPRP